MRHILTPALAERTASQKAHRTDQKRLSLDIQLIARWKAKEELAMEAQAQMTAQICWKVEKFPVAYAAIFAGHHTRRAPAAEKSTPPPVVFTI